VKPLLQTGASWAILATRASHAIGDIDRIGLPAFGSEPLPLEQNAIDRLAAALRFRRIEEGITLL